MDLCLYIATIKFASLRIFKRNKVNSLAKDKKLFSFHYKRIYKSKINIELPSIMTRKRDKLFFPDTEIFEMSIQKMFKLPII